MKLVGPILLLTAAMLTPAAASFDKINPGGQAIGLGSAYVAVAYDASAIYWNPAGMTLPANDSLLHRQLTLAYSPLFGLSYLQHKFIGFVQNPIQAHSHLGALGVGLVELNLCANRENAQTLSYTENTVLFSWSCPPIFKTLAIGGTFKYYHIQTAQPAYGFGGDLGLITSRKFHSNNWKINVRLGLLVQDIGKSRIYYRKSRAPGYYEWIDSHYRLGLALNFARKFSRLAPIFLFSADLHRQDRYAPDKTEVNLGGEVTLLSCFALRSGIQDLARPRYAYGFSVSSPKPIWRRSFIVIDIALLTHPDLNPTMAFSLSILSRRS